MRIAIHQPQFMPWLGYFDKMKQADLFVLLDNVQFKKNEFQNRNKIKTPNKWQWLTVPVSFNFGDKINEVKINNKTNWRRKHLQAIKTNYSKAPFFKEIYPLIEALYKDNYDLLVPLNYKTIILLKNLLRIETELVWASSIQDCLSEDPTDRLIEICKYFKAKIYLAGAGGKDYMDCERCSR